MSLFTAFRKEWMEALRNYRLLIVAVVLVFFGLISPFLAKYMPELMKLIPTGDITISAPTPTVVAGITQYVKNIAQAGLFLALLLTMGAIAQEKDKGTAAMMLVKPLSRSAFLGAKFLNLGAIFAVSLALAGIASYYYTILLFEVINILDWLVLNAFIFIYVLVIVSITLFCSTVTKSQAATLGITVGLLVVGWMVSGILGIGEYLPGELYTWGVRLLLGDSTASWPAMGVSIGLILVSLMAAWLVFRRQEL